MLSRMVSTEFGCGPDAHVGAWVLGVLGQLVNIAAQCSLAMKWTGKGEVGAGGWGKLQRPLLPPTGRHSKSWPAVLPQATITALKREIENSWRMVDSSHEKASCRWGVMGCPAHAAAATGGAAITAATAAAGLAAVALTTRACISIIVSACCNSLLLPQELKAKEQIAQLRQEISSLTKLLEQVGLGAGQRTAHRDGGLDASRAAPCLLSRGGWWRLLHGHGASWDAALQSTVLLATACLCCRALRWG